MNNEEIRHRVTRNFSIIVANLDPDKLSDFLIESLIISVEQYHQIKSYHKTKEERCRELLSLMMMLNAPNTWIVFMEALRQKLEWKWIEERINRQEYLTGASRNCEGNAQPIDSENRSPQIEEYETRLQESDQKVIEVEKKLCEVTKELENQKELQDKIIANLRQENEKKNSEMKEEKRRFQELKSENKRLNDKCKNLETKLKDLDSQFYSTDDKQWKWSSGMVQMINTQDDGYITGAAIAGQELFVSGSGSAEIKVYDLRFLKARRKFPIDVLVDPYDLAYCKINNCLYIMDIDTKSYKIIRSTTSGKILCSWSTHFSWGSISVAFDSNIILTSSSEGFIFEYTSKGVAVRKIQLSKEAGWGNPEHCIKLESDRFLVSNVFQLGVCVIGLNGNVIMAYGDKHVTDNKTLDWPTHMAIDSNGSIIVIDRNTSRLFLFDSKLNFMCALLIPRDAAILERIPYRLVIDELHGRLFVGDGFLCES